MIAKRHRLGLNENGRKNGPPCRANRSAVGVAPVKEVKPPRPPMVAEARRLRPDQVTPVRPVEPGYIEAPAPDSPGLKSLMERGARECAWPVGAPDRDRGQLFCSAPVAHGAYCASHGVGRGVSMRRYDVHDPNVRSVNPPRPRRDPNPALAKWGREW